MKYTYKNTSTTTEENGIRTVKRVEEVPHKNGGIGYICEVELSGPKELKPQGEEWITSDWQPEDRFEIYKRYVSDTNPLVPSTLEQLTGEKTY